MLSETSDDKRKFIDHDEIPVPLKKSGSKNNSQDLEVEEENGISNNKKNTGSARVNTMSTGGNYPQNSNGNIDSYWTLKQSSSSL